METSELFRFRCSVCGAPRLPNVLTRVDSLEKAFALKKASDLRTGFAVSFLFATLISFVAAVAFAMFGKLLVAFAIFAVAASLLLASVLFRRIARGTLHSIPALVDQAWAEHFVSVPGETAEALSSRLRISEDQAENLLARSSVEQMVRIGDTNDWSEVEARDRARKQ